MAGSPSGTHSRFLFISGNLSETHSRLPFMSGSPSGTHSRLPFYIGQSLRDSFAAPFYVRQSLRDSFAAPFYLGHSLRDSFAAPFIAQTMTTVKDMKRMKAEAPPISPTATPHRRQAFHLFQQGMPTIHQSPFTSHQMLPVLCVFAPLREEKCAKCRYVRHAMRSQFSAKGRWGLRSSSSSNARSLSFSGLAAVRSLSP